MTYRLLLADDSVTIQKVVELTFSDVDFDVISVSDGKSALEKIKSLKPDVILSDVIMPGMNGYDLCTAVKQDAELSRIPFLFLRGTFESFDEERAASVGADGFIVKPFESQELINKVNELVEKSRLAAAPAPPAAAPAVVEEPREEEIVIPSIEEALFGEIAQAPAAAEAAESFAADFGSPVEAVQAEPQTVSEEDLWSEVKISDHPIPAPPVEKAGPAVAPAEAMPEAILEEQPVLEEVQPYEEVFEEAPPAAAKPEPVLIKEALPAAEPAAAPVPEPVSVSVGMVEKVLAEKIEEVLRSTAPEIIREVTRKVISEIVWEVVPDTAERLIRKEIERLTGRGSA